MGLQRRIFAPEEPEGSKKGPPLRRELKELQGRASAPEEPEGLQKESPLLRELEGLRGSLHPKRSQRGSKKGVSVPKGTRGAPKKSLCSRRAKRALMGVSAPKGARRAPLESPPQMEPEKLRRNQGGSRRSPCSKRIQRGSENELPLQKSQGRGSKGVSFPRAPLQRAPVEPGGLQKEYPPQMELEGFREDPLLQKEAEQP